MAEVPICLLRGQRWAKEALGVLEVDKSTLLWSTSSIPSSSMFSGACYSERALGYICAARRSVDPLLPPLTDSHIWFKTFSVPESLPFEHLITSTYQMGCNKQIANLLVTGLCYVEEISMEKMKK